MNYQECQYCKKIISSNNIQKHIVACERKLAISNSNLKGSILHICHSCNKNFKTLGGLKGHIHLKHENPQQSINASLIRASKNRGKPGKKHSLETKEKLSLMACERLSKHSKYTKNIEYRPGIWLESSYEVRVAEILDKLGIEWSRCRDGFIWNDNGQIRRYIPDFYIPKLNIYLDPKNDYLIKKDKFKIDSAMALNNINVIVLSDQMITEDFISSLFQNIKGDQFCGTIK